MFSTPLTTQYMNLFFIVFLLVGYGTKYIRYITKSINLITVLCDSTVNKLYGYTMRDIHSTNC